KYGYAAKGASVVLYRDSALRKHQFYVYTDWSGGIYGSPAVTGTRPGGAIAAAWTALQYFGREGYEAKARQCLEVVEKIRVAVEDLPDVYILGQPDMTILALASDSVDIYEVGDELGLKGWYLDRQQHP
ncbi:MAG: aspartate aminotransferase family protein, partial [Saprospiraceae bacterium]|nr:aspartate aminotransferase family protein [Saprospiraceae bacterium]